MTADATDTADGPRTSARRERTRERLLDAALALFAEHGVEATSIEAICDGAGFTRGAFYSNFEDKAALIDALSAREQDRAVEQLRAAILNAPWAGETCDGAEVDTATIGRIVTTLLRALTLDPRWGVVNSELRLRAMRDPRAAAAHAARETAVMDAIADEISALMARIGVVSLIPEGVYIRLLISGFQTELERALLTHASQAEGDAATTGDPFAEAAESAASWLPTVIDHLTRLEG